MNKFNKIAISLALVSTAAVHGLSMAHQEHDTPTPKVQSDVKAGLVREAESAKIIFTKGAESVSTIGATGTLTLLDTKAKTSYPLVPAPENSMTSDGLRKLAKGNRAQVHVTFANKTMLVTEVVAK